MIRKNWVKILFMIVLVASIIFRFGLLHIFKGLWWDEAVYLSLGRDILRGKYSIDGDMETFRPPLFPFINALGHILGGEYVTRIIVLIFSILGMITTLYLGKSLYDKEIGFLAAVFVAASPLYLFFGQKILTESIFVTFSSVALLTFYLGVEKNRKYLYLTSIFTALSCLTKYFGFYLLFFYILYVIFRKKIKIIKKKEFWISVILFLLFLSPIFVIGMVYYKNPVGGILKNILIYQTASKEPYYIYITNSIEIFGLSALLIPFGIFWMLRDRKASNTLILISCILPFLIFSFVMQHRETRYLVSFLPIFGCVFGFTVKKLVKKTRSIIIIIVVLFLAYSFYLGYEKVSMDRNSGEALKNGSLFIGELTEKEEYIMSESYPYISYYADRNVIIPPDTKEKFYRDLNEYKIRYVLINLFEPGNPDYLSDELQSKNFEEVEWFSQWGYRAVIIYKKL